MTDPPTVSAVQGELDAIQDALTSVDLGLDDEDKAYLGRYFQNLDQKFEEMTADWGQ